MKLCKLEIRNFGQVLDATLYLADKGLVSIEGVNQDATGSDSNGAGKSTIINAIIWCNYGEAGKTVKADSVINSKVKKNCMVSSTWVDGDETYKITRYRKDTTWKNAVRIETLQSGKWLDVTKAGAREVQLQIDGILGQDYLTFQASCFAQQDEALDIPKLTDKGLKELLEKVLPFENLQEQHAEANKTLQKHNSEIKKIIEQINLKTYQVKMHKEAGIKAVKAFKTYAGLVEEKNKNIDYTINSKKLAVKSLSSKVLGKDKDKLVLAIKTKKAKVDSFGDCNLAKAQAVYLMHKYAYEERKTIYDSADTRCHVCKQETESQEDYRSRLKPDLDRLEMDMVEAKKTLDKIEDKVSLREAIFSELEDLNEELKELEESTYRIASLEREIRLLEGQKLSVGTNPHQAHLNDCRAGYSAAIKDKADLQAKLDVLKEELVILEAVEFTFSPKGVRYHMLESIAPTLTENTNKYLKVLTDGAIVANWSTVVKTGTKDYKEKFKIDCSMKGMETEYGALSGGEKRKLRLACFFGLQDLIASRATKNISIWCGDEIDHALDGAGIERLMSLLDAKTKTKSTILVISHNELRDWIPNVAVVTRKNDVSVITGYLNAN